METSFYHRLARALWIAVLALLLVLAVYVSFGRLVMANIGAYREAILQELNVRLPFSIEAETVRGSWHSFTPYIVLTGLTLSFPGEEIAPLSLTEGRMGLDVIDSLRTRSLQVTRVTLDDLLIRGRLDAEGGLALVGFSRGEGETSDWLQEFLLNIESVELRNNVLNLALPGQDTRELALDLQLVRDGSHRRLDARLEGAAGTRITVVAEGVGDFFRPGNFVGEGYLGVMSQNLAAMRDLMPGLDPGIWVKGEGEMELWALWQRGEPELEMHLDAKDLVVAPVDGGWSIPLDRLSWSGQFEDKERHRRFYVTDVELSKDGIDLALPAMQLDSTGMAMRLRARDLPLAPVAALLSGAEPMPEKLREVIDGLAPDGRVDLLQLQVGDVRDPAADWELSASFSDLSVQPFLGAPGGTSVSGFTRLEADGGQVIIDSQGPVLDFPKIFARPLAFDEIHGTLDLAWDEQSFDLRSGLLTAQGEEGAGKVLFGLRIPLQEDPVGPEMDLLVGMQDLDPAYRDKYLPYTLPRTLLDWLDASIGPGLVTEGAFLWRGALRPDSGSHRTVQLGFNAADTLLAYSPDWPPVQMDDATIYIDDGAVSGWSGRSTVYGSTASDVSVETRQAGEGRTLLTVGGSLTGPAADGLRVLNETPLSPLVSATFADWQASGGLDVELLLGLTLGPEPPPALVEVDVDLVDVDLSIAPGNLQLSGAVGTFSYSTETGFESSDLSASLWGEPLRIDVSQQLPPGVTDFSDEGAEVSVNFESQASMDAVRRWLGLDLLAMATGSSAVEGRIRIRRGQAAVLEIDSDLVGVSLDLPPPWDKPAAQARRLAVSMPLADSPDPMAIDIGPDLRLRLDLEAGRLLGGSFGVGFEPVPIEAGLFQVSGTVPTADAEQWQAFVTRYFIADPAAEETLLAGSAVDANGQPAQPLPEVRLQGLAVGDLRGFGQRVQDATLDLSLGRDYWDFALAADWVSVSGRYYPAGGPTRITFQHLDLDGLAGEEGETVLAPDTGDAGEAAPMALSLLSIPRMDIDIRNLFQGPRRVGELSFYLSAQDGSLLASNLVGQLAGLTLRDDRDNRLVWHQGREQGTVLDLGMVFEDFSDTLAFFGYEQILETRGGELSVNLSWPDDPGNFDLVAARGEVLWHMERGSFHRAPASASGALRVVSILNLADIVRRLSLTHMFESGIPFDSVDGVVRIDHGVLIVPKLEVEGGSSFRFMGMSDLQAQTLSGELVATLPVANNLPWIAALTANLPVAAGVYVISRIFDKQMSRISSLVYGIDGSWNEPQVAFSRVFDDQMEVADFPDTPAPSTESAAGTAADSAQEPVAEELPGAAPAEAGQG